MIDATVLNIAVLALFLILLLNCFDLHKVDHFCHGKLVPFDDCTEAMLFVVFKLPYKGDAFVLVSSEPMHVQMRVYLANVMEMILLDTSDSKNLT